VPRYHPCLPLPHQLEYSAMIICDSHSAPLSAR